jgi:hypothetical protein
MPEEKESTTIFTPKQILNFVITSDHYDNGWDPRDLSTNDALIAMNIYGKQCIEQTAIVTP